MPMVTIKWTPRTEAEREAVARGVAAALESGAGVPADHVWIAFEEVEPDAFFVGPDSIAARRRARGEAT